MGSVFKKFTAQDKAMVPFNAHKQYNFTSASAASNALTWFNTSWTSESISLYSSASAVYGGDIKNVDIGGLLKQFEHSIDSLLATENIEVQYNGHRYNS